MSSPVPSSAASSSPAPADRPALVARLRAAGCVYAEDEADLLLSAADTAGALEDMTRRRVAGLPLEQILGWVEFCGLRIPVEPGVFVPRSRTAMLVAVAAEVAGDRPGVVELCCGSGAAVLALAARVVPRWLFAVDIDAAAVHCARGNLAAIGGQVFQGDLFDPLPTRLRGQVDLVLANAPYVPSAAVALLPPEARLHEPPVALDGGVDGLDVVRRIAAQVASWLAPGGHLVIEASSAQSDAVCDLLGGNGLVPAVRYDPDTGGVVVIARDDRPGTGR